MMMAMVAPVVLEVGDSFNEFPHLKKQHIEESNNSGVEKTSDKNVVRQIYRNYKKAALKPEDELALRDWIIS